MARNENPNVRTQSRSSTAPNKDVDEPWISNYPPLHDWLNENDARCDWQMRYGKGKQGFMLEQWRLPGSLPFIVLVYAGKAGWDIFTPGQSVDIAKTLADTKARVLPCKHENATVISSGMDPDYRECPSCGLIWKAS